MVAIIGPASIAPLFSAHILNVAYAGKEKKELDLEILVIITVLMEFVYGLF